MLFRDAGGFRFLHFPSDTASLSSSEIFPASSQVTLSASLISWQLFCRGGVQVPDPDAGGGGW